jgi:hypothetical protein
MPPKKDEHQGNSTVRRGFLREDSSYHQTCCSPAAVAPSRVRILPVFGKGGLSASPRIGHLRVNVGGGRQQEFPLTRYAARAE